MCGVGTDGGCDVKPWRLSVTGKSSNAPKSKGKSRSGVSRPDTSLGVV